MSSVLHPPDASALQAGSMLPEPWVVVSRLEENADTFTIELRPAEEGTLRPFAPGQFNMLYAFGTGESAISISGSPENSDTRVHTIRRVGTVTSALDRLAPGDTIGLRGPFGSAWPIEELPGRDLVFVAGGIGLAPLRPAILHALAHRKDYGRIVILAGARSPEDLIFHDELLEWKEEPDVEVKLTVDRAGIDWYHHVGVVTTLIPQADFDPANAVAMVCGPEIMMRFTAVELNKNGLPDSRLFVTLERNMKCAVGICGHCQFGPEFICRDGPVFRYDHIHHWFSQREV
ncbi:MAG: FAD/NAD(P)-binding protein [Verrucomicrobiales bacterium]|nr:FAD/NAD(P)-binding protein [Verrucomicrobiales bacterium]